jgi:uncharacterized membrane protein YgdD (TMEM256/DUF423 family)
MRTSIWVMAAPLNCLLAVAAGAAAAHLFAGDPQRIEWMRTGAQYALYHAAALVAVTALAATRGHDRTLAAVAVFFIAGMVLFSLSLYLLALTGSGVFAFATPFGGIAFMLGWGTLAVYAWRTRQGGA